MEIINTARQTGKTYKILQEMKKNKKALMITFSEMDKRRLISENPDLSLRIMSLQEYHNKSDRGDTGHFDIIHIDNLDMILRIGHKIGIMTMTNYPEKLENGNNKGDEE